MSSHTISMIKVRLGLATGSGVIRLYIALLALGGTLVWSAIFATWPTSISADGMPSWFLLAALAYATEAWVVHVHYRRQAHTLSLNELVIVLGLFFVSPLGLLFAQLLGPPLALALNRRQRSVKLLFNVTQLVFTTGLAVIVFELLLGSAPLESYRAWGAAMVAISVHAIIGVVLVAVAIGIAEGEWSAREILQTSVFSVVGSVAAGSLALVAVELISNRPAALILLLVPTTLCGIAFSSYMRQRQEGERLDFLYESMRKTQAAADPGLVAHELLLSARHLLRADYSELLILSVDGLTGTRFVSGSGGDIIMQAAPLDEVERSTLSVVLRARQAILLPRHRPPDVLDLYLERRGVDDAIVAALRGENRLLGLIVVGERSSDVATFEADDVGLLDTFAGHASVVLENNRLEQSLAEVTELKEQLHYQVLHDHLTGLPNRLQFADAVRHALERSGDDGSSTAVMFLDLDGFKAVNDTLGHAAGDELLVEVARRLRFALRPGDTPSRLGGDEFAAVLVGADAEGARHVTERVLDELEQPYRVAGQEVVSHPSLGVAIATGSIDANELISNADIAMYTAKADELRRYVFYEPSFHTVLRRRRELALELERAVERGEIEVYFQPVIDLAHGGLHAFEALARWRHPRRGLVTADEFIPVAEESGLIVGIGRAVIHAACAQAGVWQAASPGHGVGLWLNLSPAEFGNDHLVEELAIEIAGARIDARQITVEVTESSVIREPRQSTTTLQRLRALGVSISIDDFGTGYSSLSRLGDLPIDMVKIPKPFVDRLAGDSPDVTVVDAVLRLASSLGLIAVAEGVESEDQVACLRELGCGLVQGYLFGRPVESSEALKLLRRSSLELLPEQPAA